MTAWPGNPVGSMEVDNFKGGTDCQVVAPVGGQQTVSDATIDFKIDITYTDHPYFDHGRGYFSVELDRLTTNGWSQVTSAAKILGDDSHDGDWSDSITVSVTMADAIEQYRLKLHCETRNTSLGTSQDGTVYAQAIQGTSSIGDFTLDFVPASIVYCPPGQDMTASLTQSESYGTRFTIGESSGMQADTGVQCKIDFLGIVGEGVGFSQSQSVTNTATSGIQISHFRNTVVTADNQHAIGRAYWGPLGDIFVILVNPKFAVSRRADGTLFYAMSEIEQVLIVPAWKLLRPDGDPIAAAIPADVRKRLLELDPFITNLDLFFPDSGADLSRAANPFADPSANNRAELLGRWWLDTGSELNYAIGESQQLSSTQASEVKFSSTVSINASVGASYDGIAASLGMTSSDTTTVGFQTSKETDASMSTTASCYLIHNQNERDLDGIEIYYDKIYSTFMFRRVLARARPGRGQFAGAVIGRVLDRFGAPLRMANVELRGRGGRRYTTTTSAKGEYSFSNVPPGKYTLVAGNRRAPVEITESHTPLDPVRLNLPDVRRVIDLRTAPVWEVREALDLPSDIVRAIGARIDEIGTIREIGELAEATREQRAAWRDGAVVRRSAPAEPPRRGRRRRPPRADRE